MRTAAKSPDSRASGGRESGAAGRVSRDELSVAIEGALRRMTLAAKIRLLSGADSFSLHGDSEIALDSIVLSDGPTGVRGDVVVGGRESCLLPNASLLAQTWSREALSEVGAILADEAADQETHVVLGPTINLHRSPLGGRLFEAFSEDPLLTGHLAAVYIDALQSRGISASVKHYLGNESETDRTTVDIRMSAKTMREVYLAPFEVAVEDANPWTLMAAYNNVNGLPSTEHSQLMSTILKDEWSYDGLVMSDWFATKSAAESANAGLDLVMPGPATPWTEGLLNAVHDGRVSESTIDEHVRRLLTLAHRVGAFASRPSWPERVPAPAGLQRREQLTRLAASGMVVLKNENQTLPLRDDSVVTLIGRHAIDTIAQGGGSARVRAPHVVSIVDGLGDRLRAGRVRFVDGVETRQTLPVASPELVRDPEDGQRGIRVRVLSAEGSVVHSRHADVADLEDSKSGWLENAARIELSAVLDIPESVPMQVGTRGPGNWHLKIQDHERSYRIPYHPGPGGGFFRPKSDAVTVRVEPGQLVTATVESDEMPRILGLVLSPAARSSASVISAAAAAAAEPESDVAVVVVGLTTDQETEGEDKKSLSLPGDQDALVAAVARASSRTVVVVNAATPVLMPWIDAVDAVIFAGLPGQEAGVAVAAALLGDILPEGRLVTTFPNRNRQGPAWSTTPRNGELKYTEGTFIGYRGWYAGHEPPAFWFGHGLGYTAWEYLEAEIVGQSSNGIDAVAVTIANTGEHSGVETIQVYLDPQIDDDPIRLVGWAQAPVRAGESTRIVVGCDHRFQRSWDETFGWRPLRRGRLVIARGLGDVRITMPIAADIESSGANA